jgi:hypothetical protein
MFAAYRALINVNVISCRILSPHEQDMMTTTRFLLDNTALIALCYLVHDLNRNSRRLTRNLRGVLAPQDICSFVSHEMIIVLMPSTL